MNRSNEEESFKNIVIKIDKKKQIVSCYFPSTSLSFMASNTERYPADVFNTWMENVDWNWRFEIFKESEEFFFFLFLSTHSVEKFKGERAEFSSRYLKRHVRTAYHDH